MAARIAGLIAAFLFLLMFVACVDVPEGIRANFAAPAPQERSNYRPGEHGTARPEALPPPPLATRADAGPPATDVGTTTTTGGAQ